MTNVDNVPFDRLVGRTCKQFTGGKLVRATMILAAEMTSDGGEFIALIGSRGEIVRFRLSDWEDVGIEVVQGSFTYQVFMGS